MSLPVIALKTLAHNNRLRGVCGWNNWTTYTYYWHDRWQNL